MFLQQRSQVSCLQAQIGEFRFARVVLANTYASRLRGWYGYRCAALDGKGIDAVLLTATRSVHTIAMPFALNLLWLDQSLRCIKVSRNVGPWRLSSCRRASHVLEWAACPVGSWPKLSNEVCGQQLKIEQQDNKTPSKEA